MLNRSTAPSLKIPSRLAFPKPEEVTFANGINLSAINSGMADVIRLSLVFNAGTRYQTQSFVASSTINMLCEGTKAYSAAKLAEQLDFYGSSLEVSIDRDFSTVTIYSLGKYFEETLGVLEQLVKYPAFPEKELSVYAQKNKERLIFERQRVDKQAGELLASSLYGESHPYGSFGQPNDYDALTTKMLADYHYNFYTSKNTFAVVSGNISDDKLKCIERFIGMDSWGNLSVTPVSTDFSLHPSASKHIVKEKDDAVQSSIRMGKVLFNRNHPDYNGLVILNTILGGYFGSRLMKNIREDKGYTYGIYSAIVGLKESGYLTIATDTGCEYTQACIDEIKKEVTLLQSELISNEELELVKNYTIGDMLRSLDGPWALADVLIDLKQSNLDFTQVGEFYNELKNITPQQLQKLAQTYFNLNELTEVIVGRL